MELLPYKANKRKKAIISEIVPYRCYMGLSDKYIPLSDTKVKKSFLSRSLSVLHHPKQTGFFQRPPDESVLHVLFPCKGRVRRGHAKERLHYFRKNYCGSLPQIMLIWVFRKILPEIPWLYSPVTALLDHQQEKRLKAIRSR